MKFNTAIMKALNGPCDKLDSLRSWLEEGGETVQKPSVEESPLDKRCYLMSESHLSGYRLLIGFETLEDVEAAHEFLARRKVLR